MGSTQRFFRHWNKISCSTPVVVGGGRRCGAAAAVMVVAVVAVLRPPIGRFCRYFSMHIDVLVVVLNHKWTTVWTHVCSR